MSMEWTYVSMPQQLRRLPEPEGGAAALRLREPGVKPSRWTHILDRVSGKDSRQRDWTEED